MRRIRKVHVLVSSNFYDILENERRKLSNKVNSKCGINRNISFPSFTEMLAQKAKENGGRFGINKKQTRRRF